MPKLFDYFAAGCFVGATLYFLAAWLRTLITIRRCAWCDRLMGIRWWAGGHTTHGMCHNCKAQFTREALR